MDGETKQDELCKNCGKPIKYHEWELKSLQWMHADGFFNCAGRTGHSDTYAERRQP